MRIHRLRCLLFFILLLPATAFAQLKIYSPAPTSSPAKKAVNKNARVQAVEPVSLPFWDDFSFAKGHAADSLWLIHNTVSINSGQGINPPTLNVATFDGYNEDGLPYSSVPLETGYGDTLESQPIYLGEDHVPVSQRNAIYLSFFYQPGGNSEMPNPSDFLRLEFKSTKGWREIKTFRVKPDNDPTIFYDTAIQIPQRVISGQDTIEYYHNDFQFRFVAFGRLSGAYDAWHLDYVYLNRRIFNDRNTNISDRALASPLSSIFGDYFSIPYSHLKSDVSENFKNLNFEIFNLKDTIFFEGENELGQVLNYKIFFTINNYKDSNLLSSHKEGEGQTDKTISPIQSRERKFYEILDRPSMSNFDSDADSVTVNVLFGLGGGDQKVFPDGDYSYRYRPIEFRSNDTIQHTFQLSSYYAYDDGEAEYAAGLAVQGNQLAYRFVLANIDQDVLNGAYIYFPFFGGTVPATMEIFVFGNKNGKPDINEMYSQLIPVTRTANNLFTKINFTQGVMVQDTFYLGYLETQTGDADRIRIGLDTSHDTGDQIFYRNTYLHPWQQNTVVHGSLMMRPSFGEATVITGVENEPKPVSIYPNPNRGEFYLKGIVNKLQVLTITGKSVSFSIENFDDTKKITLHASTPGMYLVRYQSGTKVYTDKILVKTN